MKKKRIAVLAGDGVGPEVMHQALRLLEVVQSVFGFEFQVESGLIGGAAFESHGEHFPSATQTLCSKC